MFNYWEKSQQIWFYKPESAKKLHFRWGVLFQTTTIYNGVWYTFGDYIFKIITNTSKSYVTSLSFFHLFNVRKLLRGSKGLSNDVRYLSKGIRPNLFMNMTIKCQQRWHLHASWIYSTGFAYPLGAPSILVTNFLVKSPPTNHQFLCFKSSKCAVWFSCDCGLEMFIATEL